MATAAAGLDQHAQVAASRVELRNQGVDLLRGLAILLVMLLHVVALTPFSGSNVAIELSISRLSTGVQLFFVLSGFLVCKSIDRSLATGEGIFGYFVRRSAKIIPLYYIFLIINLCLFYINSNLFANTDEIRNSVSELNLTPINLTAHILLLQGFFPKFLHTLVDGSWSIVIEVYFYVMFPVLFALCGSVKNSLFGYGISLIIGAIFILGIGRYYSGYSIYGFPAQLHCFMLGIICFQVKRNSGISRSVGALAAPIAFIAVIILVAGFRLETKPLPATTLPALCFAALLFSADWLADQCPNIIRRVLVHLGRQSYALFFVHMSLLREGQVLMGHFLGAVSIPAHLVINIGLGLVGSVILSHFAFDPIDRHFVRRAPASITRRLAKNSIKVGEFR